MSTGILICTSGSLTERFSRSRHDELATTKPDQYIQRHNLPFSRESVAPSIRFLRPNLNNQSSSGRFRRPSPLHKPRRPTSVSPKLLIKGGYEGIDQADIPPAWHDDTIMHSFPVARPVLQTNFALPVRFGTNRRPHPHHPRISMRLARSPVATGRARSAAATMRALCASATGSR